MLDVATTNMQVANGNAYSCRNPHTTILLATSYTLQLYSWGETYGSGSGHGDPVDVESGYTA